MSDPYKKQRAGNKHRGKQKLPPFVALPWEMLNHQAYRKLKHSAAHALPYFLGKVKLTYNDPQRYQTEFTFSYSEGKKLRFGNATFYNIIQELVRKGFIDPVDRGGMKSDCRGFSNFRLSRRWEEYGKEGFQAIEWKCFLPKPRLKATPEMEMHSTRNGNKTAHYAPDISRTGAVGAETG